MKYVFGIRISFFLLTEVTLQGSYIDIETRWLSIKLRSPTICRPTK